MVRELLTTLKSTNLLVLCFYFHAHLLEHNLILLYNVITILNLILQVLSILYQLIQLIILTVSLSAIYDQINLISFIV